jgi:hypothetical protein
MAQLHDNEQVDVTISAVDAKGFETADAITYEVVEGDVTVVGATDEDSHTATIVAGTPGPYRVTATDATAIDPVTNLPLAADISGVVSPAGAVSISVTEGTPVVQP